MPLRLPKHLDLGIARIPIKLVGRSEMADAADCDEGEDPPDGLWDCEHEVIYIGKWLPAKEKRTVLYHEILHAANDQQYYQRFSR